MLELVTCDFTWERNNDYKGRARLAYPLSPEWNWKLVFIEFRIRLSELIKTKTKLLWTCRTLCSSSPAEPLWPRTAPSGVASESDGHSDWGAWNEKCWVSVSVLSKTEEGRRGRKLQKPCLVEHRLPGDSSVGGSPWEMVPITFWDRNRKSVQLFRVCQVLANLPHYLSAYFPSFPFFSHWKWIFNFYISELFNIDIDADF